MKKHGIGLYSWEQIKAENAVTFTAAVLFGAVLVFTGVLVGVWAYQLSTATRDQFGRVDIYWEYWLGAVGLVLIGVFVAHAGVIYWFRRIFRR